MVTPAEYVANFNYRVLQDALNESTVRYWLHRAEVFEWTKPRLDDFHGKATKSDLSARWQRADKDARACRERARLALGWDELPDDVWAALYEIREAA